jgi:hypothetical protein
VLRHQPDSGRSGLELGCLYRPRRKRRPGDGVITAEEGVVDIRRKYHPISWREIRRRFTGPGTRFTHNGVTFYGASSVKIERYRHRGGKIPNPWTITTPATTSTAA